MKDATEQLEMFAEFPAMTEVRGEVAGNPESDDFPVRILYKERLKKSIRCRKIPSPADGGKGLLSNLFSAMGFADKTLRFLYELELPAYMDSPEFSSVRLLAKEWAVLSFKRKTAGIRAKLSDLISRIWRLSEQILVDSGREPVGKECRFPPIRPVGKFHDLNKVFEAVNEMYFHGELRARITWSGRIGGLSFHTKRTDPLTGEVLDLISISRGYDFGNCPFYAVAGVVYHECLHIVIPPEIRNGRRIVHGKNFRQRERRYIYYEQWAKWHREVLPKNVRALRRT